jgi:hypothetical protein
MEDTAQAEQPAETRHDQIANAANAFKAFDVPEVPEKNRDDRGRFAVKQEEAPEVVEDEPELEAEAEGEGYDEDAEEDSYDDGEEPEEVEAQPLPPSWPEDMAETWRELPTEAQAYIAQRDAEQTRALNAKFQEIANARKAAEAEARAEANAKRDEYLQELERVSFAIQNLAGTEPDPRAFGYGTQNFNQAAYQQAYQQWQQSSQTFAQLEQQRESLMTEKQQAEKQEFEQWKQSIEAEWAPKLLEVAPELKDPVKGAPFVQSMVDYAKANGIPEDVFSPENQTAITSPELLMIWKAMQYDKARSGNAKPKPKPGPSVKPGVSSPRSARKNAKVKANRDRLAREGSIEAGAAVWKDFL